VVAEMLASWAPASSTTGLAGTVGATVTARRWVVAEPDVDAEQFVTVFNPGTRPVSAALLPASSIDRASGPTSEPEVAIPPGQAKVIRLALLGDRPVPAVVTANGPVVVEGYEMRKDQDFVVVDTNPVTDGYFETMQLPLIAGRAFDARDSATSAPVAIINESMAEKYWPGRNALGGVIRMNGKRLEVVGITKNARLRELSAGHIDPFMHLPFSQFFGSQMTLHVETQGDSASLSGPVLAEVRGLDSALPVHEVRTIENFFREGAMFFNRLIMQLIVAIGVMGLLLSIVGLYGVIAYSVSRRTKEIGIRMAIGADRASVLRSVLLEGLGLSGIGVVIGLAAAFAGSEVLSIFLVRVGARDAVVFTAVPALLIAVSLAACYLPARRAAQVDPLLALRNE